MTNSDRKGTGGLALPAGTLLGRRYQTGQVLGEGGFGITYDARDTENRRRFAIKEYVPSGAARRAEGGLCLEADPGKEYAFARGRERFEEEIQILGSLRDIPQVVRMEDTFQENQTVYLVMEYLEGETLSHILKRDKSALGREEITRIISQTARTLARIHNEKGILHRDVSPENIFILKNGEVKLIDFGSAEYFGRGRGKQFAVVLKRSFAPIEQYGAGTVQGRYTDIYALAGTYYYALTGTAVPPAPEREKGTRYIPLKQLNTGVSQEVSDAVDRALLMDYRQRTQTMEQFEAEINGRRQPPPAGKRTDEKEEIHVQKKKIPSVPARPWVELCLGGGRKTRWNLLPDQEVKVGRQASLCNIVTPGFQAVSKLHCVLRYDSARGEFLVKDVSTNGVFTLAANQKERKHIRLTKNVWTAVAPGTVLILAVAECRIQVGREA